MFMRNDPLQHGAGYRLMEKGHDRVRSRLVSGALLVAMAGALAACDAGPDDDAGEVIDEQPGGDAD
jgi:hypothetical protein